MIPTPTAIYYEYSTQEPLKNSASMAKMPQIKDYNLTVPTVWLNCNDYF